MKNMFGDEVKPRVLTTKFVYPHLEIFINGQWHGMVSPNGVHGYSMDLHHTLGEPVMNNVHLWNTLSFKEMSRIMNDYKQGMGNRGLPLVISNIAKEKKITFEEAVQLIRDKEIPVYGDIGEAIEVGKTWS